MNRATFSQIRLCLRQAYERELMVRERFCARCGVTIENAHEFTQVIFPGDKPVTLGGCFRLIHHEAMKTRRPDAAQ